MPEQEGEHALFTQAEDCCQEDSILADEQSNAENHSHLCLPGITAEEEELESRALSNEERLLAFADLYGRKEPTELATHLQLEAFEREMSRLPIKKKAALDRGYTVKQARLFLDIENNDPRRAAERMATYWEKRFEVFGENAFDKARRTKEDFFRVHEMALKVTLDSEVDGETRRWADNFVKEWNRGHVLSLDEELENMPAHEKAALVEAQKMRPDIAASDEHKLLFLRCEDFDAKKASRRMAKYWDLKFDLFGREGALRSVTVNDLMRDHPRELSVGFLRNLPGTDSFGRRIVHFVPGKMYASLLPEQGCTENGLLKVAWHFFHAMLDGAKSCGENGIVGLVDARFDHYLFNPKFTSRYASLANCFPVKVKAVHLFVSPRFSFLRMILPFVKWVIGKRSRIRLWVHTGTEEESLSELEECGISRDMIPTSFGGEVDMDLVGRAWREEQKSAGL